MKKEEEKETEINWDALDEHWKDDYEETYGHFIKDASNQNDLLI